MRCILSDDICILVSKVFQRRNRQGHLEHLQNAREPFFSTILAAQLHSIKQQCENISLFKCLFLMFKCPSEKMSLLSSGRLPKYPRDIVSVWLSDCVIKTPEW